MAIAGHKFLVTAGPTYEPIDPVRFIGNHSSGKMGFAIAEALAEKGATVILVAGPVQLTISHKNIKRVDIITARQMYEACMEVFPDCDGAILAAAVADYRPASISERKVKKTEQEGDTLTLELVKNKDILATLGQLKKEGQVLVGFSLETHNEVNFATEKLRKKNCDAIIMNSLQDEGAGFKTDTNKISILTTDGEKNDYGLKSKKEVAKDITDFIETKYFGRNIV